MHLILLAEALAHFDAGIVLSFSYHTAATELIKQYGSAEQQTLYLTQLAKGSLMGTIAHIEQPNGSVLVVTDESIAGKASSNASSRNLVLLFAEGDFFLLDDSSQAGLKVNEKPMTMGLYSAYFAES